MKKVKILAALIAFIAIILFANSTYAADETSSTSWTDFTNAKVEVTEEDNTFRWEYSLKVTGVTLNSESTYNVYIKVGTGEPDYTIDSNNEDYAGMLNDSTGILGVADQDLQEKYELNGDLYCYIVETNNKLEKGTPFKASIPRLEQHSIGSRMLSYFFNDKTDISLHEAHLDSSRKVNIKIGTISDKSILTSIKNGEANCLQKLMTYAKNASSPIYNGTVALGNSGTITSNLNLTNGAYYYVYMEMEDENGKYYPVEDVSLYQALVDNSVGKNLFDYLSSNFKWNLENGNVTADSTSENSGKVTTDTSTADKKIPYAGMQVIAFAVIIMGAIVGIFAIKNKKYKDIK